jgi:DNA-binding Lrp family transcriptional regulator
VLQLPKIDELDAQILKALLKDGRTGYFEIANQFGVSKNKVRKRCKAMEKKGIINGATTQLNLAHLGYDALATILISVEAQQLEALMALVEKITEVYTSRQYNSVYNIRAIARLKNLNELDQIKQLIKRRLPVMSLKTYIWTGVRNIPENLNLAGADKNNEGDNQVIQESVASRSDELVSIDDLDRQIIGKLTDNGRASFNKIAKELGVSTDTVVKRYHRLKENGTLKISVQINPKKIGYTAMLDFNLAFTTPGGLSIPLVESIAKIPDVSLILKTSGDYDLQVTAMVRDMAQSFDIQDQTAKICGVTKIEVSERRILEQWPTPQQYMSTF